MSREGRSQPIQSSAWHGFVGNIPPNGVLPPETVFVVENPDDRRRKTPPLDAIVLSAALKTVDAPTATPPEPIVVPLEERRRRVTPDPVAVRGSLAAVTVTPTVTPPPPVVVVAERRREPAIPAEVSSGFDAVDPPAAIVVEPDGQRRFRQPITPSALSGALAAVQPPVFVEPPPPVVSEPAGRRAPTPDPVAVNGLLSTVPAPPTTAPPAPFTVPILERGRQPLSVPTVQHGYDETRPPAPSSCEPDDRQRRNRAPLDAIVLSGVRAAITVAPTAAPNEPVVVPLDQRGRAFVIPPATAAHGFVDPGPGPVGTTPPQPTVSEPAARNRLAPDPVSISAAQRTTAQLPTVVPPGPYVVPLDERRRFLAAIPPETRRGFDDIVPPRPDLTENDNRRRLPPDPTVVSGATNGAAVPPPVLPHGPFVVPLEERRRLLTLLPPPPSIGQHGFVPPPTLPPPPFTLDRADQRKRYLPLPPYVLNGIATLGPALQGGFLEGEFHGSGGEGAGAATAVLEGGYGTGGGEGAFTTDSDLEGNFGSSGLDA